MDKSGEGPTMLNASSGFLAQASESCRVLILGSLPGRASLDAQQYYAHPRNAFWPIMAEFLGFDVKAAYADRVRQLTEAGIGLWDVIASAKRKGSLDANIHESSVVVNDFGAFFSRHRHCQAVLLNGTSAFRLFKKHVSPVLIDSKALELRQMPSTSPAYAAMSYQDKRKIWHDGLRLSEYTS